ncbi:MAG: isopentenyl-diphosphate Delta-isomerase [Gammaproteobacteria bacterium]|nr:isopentenyl-diphosphate Delta-isomerase [Gammaproteobacteria bacterium]
MDSRALRDEVVSSDAEQLILVDDEDREIGHDSKADCHDGQGVLHRAFSLFVFNDAGELLLQKRSASKRLWPLYWSNSCCSHPRRGEGMKEAIHRRLEQELGLESDLEFLYKFKYQARYGELGAEHELCWVYAGHARGPVRVNANEVAEWRYVRPAQLDIEIARRAEWFTPWLKLEWERIRREFAGSIKQRA